MTPKPCPFCAIVSGEADTAVVYQDALTLAFLDHAPLMIGHVLLVPRAHVATIFEADAATVAALALASQKLAIAVTRSMGAAGCFVAQNNVVSQSVAHLHTHVIPRRRGDGFFSPRIVWKRTRYRAGQVAETAAAIRAALAA